jgi:hypothetical protein
VIVGLLESYGQGGGCGHEHRSFTYHNSYIVADPSGAIVLETAGKLWATEEVASGVRTISNGLTISGFADAHRDRLRSRVSACDVRTGLTGRLASRALGAGDLMGVLRSHGGAEWPRYRAVNGTLRMPCMHGGGLVASSSSTAGWVADLGSGRHWITATSAQCLSLFKPTAVDDPIDVGPPPDDHDDGKSLWWRHEHLARSVMRDPAVLAPTFLPERDRLESGLLADPPSGADGFAIHADAVDRWTDAIGATDDGTDVRPWWVRRYWAKRRAKAASRAFPIPTVGPDPR